MTREVVGPMTGAAALALGAKRTFDQFDNAPTANN